MGKILLKVLLFKMEIIKFNKFAEKINYDYKKDYEKMKIIWWYTKTRVDLSKSSSLKNFSPHNGSMWEQTLFLKSIAEKINCKNFFEIGTGRGTGSLGVSLVPTVEKIITFDIRSPEKKENFSIGYRKTKNSIYDLMDKIPFKEKSKIDFRVREKKDKLEYNNFFDLCFIDGCHDNYDTIKQDFKFCLDVMKKDGIIIFDDYCYKYPIKKVVDDILKDDPSY